MLHRILAALWRPLKGGLKWHILWFLNPKFMIGVSGILLNTKGQVLLLRPRYWKKGAWGLPSGYVKRGESFEEAVIREVKEETSLTAEIDTLVQINSGFKLRAELCYMGKIIGNDKFDLDQGEILDAGFFDLKDLPEGLLPSHVALIKKVTSKNTVL